jgi:hypothetical protein
MDFLKKLRNKCESHHKSMSTGDIVLGYGLHEIKIAVEKHPTNIAMSIQDPCDGCPVCHGDINKIGVTILDNGFVIYADIRTNTACIQWACELV